MKKLMLSLIVSACALLTHAQLSPTGAWQREVGGTNDVLLFNDGYFTRTIFDIAEKKFIRSYGGPFRIDAATISSTIEFDTHSKDSVGRTLTGPFHIDDQSIHFLNETWKRIDNGNLHLAGNWRISGRMEGGSLRKMERGDRKTLKLLTATRFQWFAINPKTKEFFGTGGGTYTFKDGKYTEHIEFFSRDSSRVGAVLSFDGVLQNDTWNHSGKSSKGDPINEVWSKENASR